MKVSFFSLHKNKQFEYVPRYYDERKEKLDSKVKRIEQEEGVADHSEDYIPKIRGQFKSLHSKNIKEKKKSNIRLIIILFILTLIAYYLFLK